MVRHDLTPGQQAAQLIHAAGESAKLTPPPHGTHAVALSAPRQQLELLAERLRVMGVDHHLVHEPDSPFFGELVAIGLAPQVRSPVIRKLLQKLPLVR